MKSNNIMARKKNQFFFLVFHDYSMPATVTQRKMLAGKSETVIKKKGSNAGL